MSDLTLGNLTIDQKTNSVRMTSMSSGIDTEALTQALYEAKKLPALRIENKLQLNDAKVVAYRELQTMLGAMQDALAGLRRPPGLAGVEENLFEQKSAFFSSNTQTSPASLLGIQASNRAVPGRFDLEVHALATASKLMSTPFASASETMGAAGAGTLTIGLGSGDTADIVIAEEMTLYDVRDAINAEASTTGVSASVLKVASGDLRLILTGEETGAGADIQLGAGAVTDRLGLTTPLPEQVLSVAGDALLEIDGVAVERSQNTIDDLFSGLTIDLYQADPATTVTVEIEPNLASARDAVLTFVDAYNAFRGFLDGQRAVNDAGEVDKLAAPLFGDSLLRLVDQSLGLEVGRAVDGLAADAPTTLAELGITMNGTGRLAVDTAELDTQLLSDPDAVRRVFEFDAQVSDPALVVYEHSNALPSSSFEVSRLTDGTWQLDDGTTTLTLEQSGSSLRAPNGSAYDGLTLLWTGAEDPAAPITVTTRQGIADRLYNILDETANDLDGSIAEAIEVAGDQADAWRDDLATIEARAEDYRLALIEKFARLETALSLSEAMLDQIRSQTDAMTADR